MKKWLLLLAMLTGMLFPTAGHAAKYEELSERSTGRIIFFQEQRGYHFLVFVRPMPMDTWLCREYLSGKEVEVYPTRLQMMPFFDQGDDFAIELLTTWHLLHPRWPEYACYAAFAQMVNLPKVSQTRQFLETVRRQEREITNLMKNYHQAVSRSRSKTSNTQGVMSSGCGSCRAQISCGVTEIDDTQKNAQISAIIDLINEGDAFREIDAVYQKRDYFMTIAFFDYYRNCVNQWIGGRRNGTDDDFSDIRQKLDSMEKTLVANYRREREAYFQLEDAFARVCPRQRSLWKQGAPVSFGELVRRNDAAFHAWQRSRDLSPDCDFPEWGSLTLDILSMMPGIDDHEPIVVQFRESLKKYQDAFGNEVN